MIPNDYQNLNSGSPLNISARRHRWGKNQKSTYRGDDFEVNAAVMSPLRRYRHGSWAFSHLKINDV